MAVSMPVTSLSVMNIGDHIKWKRLPGYDHHAIVENVDLDGNKVHVIEYGSDNEGYGKNKGVVRRNRVSGVSEMYKYTYYVECNHPQQVLQRARSRLDEREYHPLMNNCEHFASWCKTGWEHCSQITSFEVRAVLAFYLAIYPDRVLSGECYLFLCNCYKAERNYEAAIQHAENDEMKKKCKQERNWNIAEAGFEAVGGIGGTHAGAAIGSSIIQVVGSSAVGAGVGNIGGRTLGKMSVRSVRCLSDRIIARPNHA